MTLPYISGLSKSIHRVFPPLAIQVTFHPFRTLRQELVQGACARTEHQPIAGKVVYSILCAECPRIYIGQTGRSLDHRLCEHRQALKNGYLGSSTLAEHMHVLSSNHRVDLLKAMLIDTHNHTQTRCMLESWHIQHHQSPEQEEGHFARTLYYTIC